MKKEKQLSDFVVIPGGYLLALFFLAMLIGVLRPKASLPQEWLFAPHPILAGMGVLFFIYIFVPNRYLFFWRNWRKKQQQA